MEQRTHRKIDPRFCGSLVGVGAGRARVVLETIAEMAADERGLVHGGFTFGRPTTPPCWPSTSPPWVARPRQ